MSTENNTNKKQVTYTQLLKQFIDKVEKYNTDIKSSLIEMIQVLRNVEKKERSAITQQLKNDLVNKGVVSRTTLYEVIKQEFEPEALLEQQQEQEQKQKIAVAAGTGDQSLEDPDQEDDIVTQRQKAKEEALNKSIKKGSAQMPRLKPSVVGSENLEGDEDEEEEDTIGLQDEDDTVSGRVTLKEHGNNIVIDDVNHLNEILEIIKSGKAVIIVVDGNLEPETISSGKNLQ